MEQSSSKSISFSLGLANEIETNSDSHSDSRILKNIHNAELPINKIIPDILYNIFTLAVYDSDPREKTVLNISHVCHHWRESAMGWPALWRFINLENGRSQVDLFMKRSVDASLVLTWDPEYRKFLFGTTPSTRYFILHATSILSRPCSLTLVRLTWTNLLIIHDIIQHFRSLPLQLRRLDIDLHRDGDYNRRRSRAERPPSFSNLVDTLYLRELDIHGMDLPWLDLPHMNLTHLAIRNPIDLPVLSHLFTFLTNCPFLEELDLDLEDNAGWEDIVTDALVTSNKLDFRCLTRLKLLAIGKSSCYYIRQFSRHIRSLGFLSQYTLTLCPPYNSEHPVLVQTASFPPLHLFEAIPSGVLPHLSEHHYLGITIWGFQVTLSGDSVPRSVSGSCRSSWPAFSISSSEICSLSFDYSPIIQLVNTMPRINHLKLQFDAWKFLTVDIRNAFPCLHTLELADCDRGTEALDALLESANLKLKTLILVKFDASADVLVDVVLRMGIEVLELKSYEPVEENEWADVISALHGKSVVVRVSQYCL